METPIRMSMFQCMITLVDMPSIRDVWWHLHKTRVTNLIARPPGSLQLVIQPERINSMQVGSVHFKMVHHDTNLSLIVFHNKKVKVSGGLQRLELFDSSKEFWDFVLKFISYLLR